MVAMILKAKDAVAKQIVAGEVETRATMTSEEIAIKAQGEEAWKAYCKKWAPEWLASRAL